MLTSVQEAALAAVSEAMADFLATTGAKEIDLSIRGRAGDGAITFSANTQKANQKHSYIFGRGESLAACVEALAVEFEKSKADTAKLRTATEALDAVKAIVADIDGERATSEKLIARIDALPVA